MWVLHAHWQPPRRATDPGGILFWAESSEGPAPERIRGQVPKRTQILPHPFCLDPQVIQERIGAGTPLEDAQSANVVLRLPTSRIGPLPSPQLNHNWDVDSLTSPYLSPWEIGGLWLPARKAFSLLVNVPLEIREIGFSLGIDARYWRTVCNLVLEVLADQKLLPVLVPSNHHQTSYLARWQPVLDGPQDGPRLAKLVSAMPPICRAETRGERLQGIEPPRGLLDSFLNTMCDALARTWGRTRNQRLLASSEHPLERWLASLFTDDPTVTNASPAQLQALSSSLQAWMRNLRAAGDQHFRIAFQLEAPEIQPGDANQPAWTLHYLLQSRDDPSLIVPAEEVWRLRGNVLTQLGKRFEQPQEKLLAGLGYAARLFPPLLTSLQAKQPTGVELSTNEAYTFLRQAAPLLEQAGFGLLAPPWWNQKGSRLGVRLHLTPRGAATPVSAGKLKLDTLISYEWQVSLGGTELTREEFEILARLKLPLVQIRGQWVQLDTEQIEAAIKFYESQRQRGEMGLMDAARLTLDEDSSVQGLPLEEVIAEGWVSEWLEHLSHQDRMVELPQPGGLQGELRPYQRYGFSWLAFFRRWGLGACLADDMGLGKTIQALALLLYEKESLGKLPGPTLLVCPTSVVTNWEREARRFAPSLRVLAHQGPDRLRNSEFKDAARNSDLVLTSYALLRLDAELMQSIAWYGVILDEAQNIKNPAAKQTQAARQLTAGFRLALTGTPVENRLSELWSIMQFLNPGFLGTQAGFRREFSLPIERFADPEATERLRKMVSPFILRRVKTDPNVITDLPEKIEMKEYCHLSEEQATLYQAAVQETMKKVEESEGIQRRGLVLSLLTQLKQICNHPGQFLHEEPETIAAAINGRSGKLARLIEMLEEVLETGERALIFTQYAEMGHVLAEALPRALGAGVLYLHGGTPAKMRDQMVHRFQEEDHGPALFILSLKAGGTGLNLTRASHVFHFDRWWNPAVEDQATDRSYRIGQLKNVAVHKFITVGTLEERVDEMIESKKGLVDSVIGAGEDWMTELSTEELRDLVALRIS